MPYVLTRADATHAHLRAWPHNALNPRGFVMVIAMTAATLAMPLIAVLGSKVLWGLLPFAGIALWGLWFALDRNWKDRAILEEMDLDRQAVRLVRTNPRSPQQDWQADPHWVTLKLVPRGGPVENYLVLGGGGREVELGAFLTPGERARLHEELSDVLLRLKSYA
jgi:Integral membrane protein